MGRLPDLFRIGRGEDHWGRHAMAELHRVGRVLPERPAADVDWMAHAAPSALVPCGNRFCDAGTGTGAGLDDVAPATLSPLVFLHRDDLAVGHHPIPELRVSELPGAGPENFAAR